VKSFHKSKTLPLLVAAFFLHATLYPSFALANQPPEHSNEKQTIKEDNAAASETSKDVKSSQPKNNPSCLSGQVYTHSGEFFYECTGFKYLKLRKFRGVPGTRT